MSVCDRVINTVAITRDLLRNTIKRSDTVFIGAYDNIYTSVGRLWRTSILMIYPIARVKVQRHVVDVDSIPANVWFSFRKHYVYLLIFARVKRRRRPEQPEHRFFFRFSRWSRDVYFFFSWPDRRWRLFFVTGRTRVQCKFHINRRQRITNAYQSSIIELKLLKEPSNRPLFRCMWVVCF